MCCLLFYITNEIQLVILNYQLKHLLLLLWIIYVFFCLEFAVPLCASVHMCLVVTCS